MVIAKLIGGPYDGETVEVAAAVRAIDVHRGDGGFSSYVPTRDGTWHYVGTSRPSRTSTAVLSPDSGRLTAHSQ